MNELFLKPPPRSKYYFLHTPLDPDNVLDYLLSQSMAYHIPIRL